MKKAARKRRDCASQALVKVWQVAFVLLAVGLLAPRQWRAKALAVVFALLAVIGL
jgi:hypothetical protein